MARVSKKAPTDQSGSVASIEALDRFGLSKGHRVRFRKCESGRWLEGTAAGIEPDGSLGLHDARGRRRSIPISDVEVRVAGPRGGKVWQAFDDLANSGIQLGMFDS